jgi:hypothetical protein
MVAGPQRFSRIINFSSSLKPERRGLGPWEDLNISRIPSDSGSNWATPFLRLVSEVSGRAVFPQAEFESRLHMSYWKRFPGSMSD